MEKAQGQLSFENTLPMLILIFESPDARDWAFKSLQKKYGRRLMTIVDSRVMLLKLRSSRHHNQGDLNSPKKHS
jgi:hypothetical protein